MIWLKKLIPFIWFLLRFKKTLLLVCNDTCTVEGQSNIEDEEKRADGQRKWAEGCDPGYDTCIFASNLSPPASNLVRGFISGAEFYSTTSSPPPNFLYQVDFGRHCGLKSKKLCSRFEQRCLLNQTSYQNFGSGIIVVTELIKNSNFSHFCLIATISR